MFSMCSEGQITPLFTLLGQKVNIVEQDVIAESVADGHFMLIDS